MIRRTGWSVGHLAVLFGWLALPNSCAPLLPQVPESAPAGLCEVAIEFAPPLPTTGTVCIDHESGWRWSGPAPPSGLVVRMPAGPASLQLTVGGDTHDRVLVVPFSAERWSFCFAR